MNVRQCKDIPDEEFYAAIRRAPGSPYAGWRMAWDVHTELESALGPIPYNLFMAKARRLVARGKITGCACGCRGDFTVAEDA
nr:hypothetical protein OG513_07700 [Streptomyces sp. NBC_00998]